MKQKRKYVFEILIFIVVILIVISSFINTKEDNSLTEDTEQILKNATAESAAVKDNIKDFIDINTKEYIDIFNGSTPKYVLIANPECQYCQIAEPILHNVIYELDVDLYYLNTDTFTEEDKNLLMTSDEFFKEGFGTPLLLKVSQSKIHDKVDGLTDKSHYLEFLKK